MFRHKNAKFYNDMNVKSNKAELYMGFIFYGKRSSVLHYSPVWLPQTNTWLYQQIRHLPPNSVESHVVCHSTTNLDQFPWPHIYSWPDKSWLGNKIFAAIGIPFKTPEMFYPLLVAGKLRPQILHSHFGNRGWTLRSLPRLIGCKHVVTFYGYDLNMLPTVEPVWVQRYAQLFADADLFLCEGPHMARCLVALGCPEDKVKVQPLGVDLASLPFRPRHRASGVPLRVLISGTFREKKGIPCALEAVGQAVAQGADLQVSVVGDSTREQRTHEEKARIMSVVEKYRLADRIQFHGLLAHQQLIDTYYDHHVFLSPSCTASNGDTEGGAPVSIIEAAATGLPVVTTTHCDIPFVLGGEGGAYFAAERDSFSLSRHLLHLFYNYEDSHQRAILARNHIVNNHDPVIQGERLAGIYNHLLYEGRP